jgi:Ca2+/H+ antiporter
MPVRAGIGLTSDTIEWGEWVSEPGENQSVTLVFNPMPGFVSPALSEVEEPAGADDLTRSVIVSVNTWALYGRHLYVTVKGHDKTFDYRAANIIDAKNYIERVLKTEFSGCEVETEGDTIVPFAYHHEGD